MEGERQTSAEGHLPSYGTGMGGRSEALSKVSLWSAMAAAEEEAAAAEADCCQEVGVAMV